MSDSEQRIREMVRAAVQEDPGVKNRVLLERAREIDPEAVEGLSLRQFHGKFRLPVARGLPGAGAKRARRRPRAERGAAAPAEDRGDVRAAVREIFRRFAVQLVAAAESRSEIVRAAARIDEFVDEVVRTVAASAGTEKPAPRRARRAATPAPPPQPLDGAPQAEVEAAAAAEPPATESAPVPERPARDMRRRRRPKALLQALQESAAAVPSPEPAAPEPEPAPEPALGEAAEVPGEEPTPVLSLSHDLEEFRRRRAERVRGRPAG